MDCSLELCILFFLVNPGKGDYQSWARHFYLTVIRHHDQGHLRKREFNLVHGSRGKEAWQQVEGTAIIPGSCKLVSWPTKNRAERSTASKVSLRALKALSHSPLQMTHSVSKAISCRTPEAWPPTHNQTFKSEPMVGILMQKKKRAVMFCNQVEGICVRNQNCVKTNK